jgi:hypothetical protein
MTRVRARYGAAVTGLLAVAMLAPGATCAAPVAESERGPVDVRPPRPGIGDVILVINAADLDQRFEKVRATPGVRVATEPYLTSYPSPDGKGTIPVRFSAVWDPDGYFVELNHIHGTAAGTEQR